ncbi:MAG: hypothetical protein KatS3mg104_0770 [Phycisphaerae bacterium]|nr:MAG: hypothetical protein KatS3mg104_0770 [Phycisphaerae bacterium]
MAIPDVVVTKILVACARHCCICRRFKPLHLHVHHIVEKSEGGTDDEQNLIATCMTCHSDVHTQTKLTRRFTPAELRMHRDAVYALVREGKLPSAEVHGAIENAAGSVARQIIVTPTAAGLMAESVEMLLAAACIPDDQGNGPTLAVHWKDPFFVRVGARNFGSEDARVAAKYSKAFQLLLDGGFIENEAGVLHRLTHEGWILADELLAAGAKEAGG